MADSLGKNKGFVSLNILQAFGAANDNLFKQIIMLGVATGGIWSLELGTGGQATISLFFSLPFILFGGFSGQFSDKFSKRSVVIVVKLWEVMLALACIAALATGNFRLCLFCVVMLGVQSTLFAPVKLGIIPELVEYKQITNANGTLGMVSNIAIILGIAIAGVFSDKYKPAFLGNNMLSPELGVKDRALIEKGVELVSDGTWLLIPGITILVLAVIGLFCAFQLPKLPPKNPDLKLSFSLRGFFGVYWEQFNSNIGKPLLAVAGAFSAFFVIAGIALLNISEYAQYLDVSDTLASAQGAFLSIAIGLGGVFVGLQSKDRVRPRFVLIGGIGMVIGFTVLGFLPKNYWLVVAMLSTSGFFAGLYMIPLQSLLQILTNDENRGRFIGFTSMLTMVGFVTGNYLFKLGSTRFGEHAAPRTYLLCAAVSAVMLIPLKLRWVPWFQRTIDEISSAEVGEPVEGSMGSVSETESL
ncbi:MAG: MFS transporter [Pirellulaceae bacterium]|jgi:acyl-[acyl-carrier-protein]-phospholipid O-acyltransferase/long-chain-fatty-acid--[acyl-carrier-protein] ligase|nr:MFS transporter [Pirellulaceae bacterium]